MYAHVQTAQWDDSSNAKILSNKRIKRDGHPDPSGAGPRNQIGWATDSPHFRAKQCNLTINSGLPSGNLT